VLRCGKSDYAAVSSQMLAIKRKTLRDLGKRSDAGFGLDNFAVAGSAVVFAVVSEAGF